MGLLKTIKKANVASLSLSPPPSSKMKYHMIITVPPMKVSFPGALTTEHSSHFPTQGARQCLPKNLQHWSSSYFLFGCLNSAQCWLVRNHFNDVYIYLPAFPDHENVNEHTIATFNPLNDKIKTFLWFFQHCSRLSSDRPIITCSSLLTLSSDPPKRQISHKYGQSFQR